MFRHFIASSDRSLSARITGILSLYSSNLLQAYRYSNW